MYHGKRMRRLNLTSAHRRALLRNLTSALIKHERIETTLPKAKEVRRTIERMITLGKRGDLHARQMAEAFVFEPKITVPKLFGLLAERYASRQGGYTRIIKSGFRKGDHAPRAIIELINDKEPIRELGFSCIVRSLAHEQLKNNVKIVDTILNAAQAPLSEAVVSNKAGPLEKRDYKKLLHQRDIEKKKAKLVQKRLEQSGMSAEGLQNLVDNDAQHLQMLLERRKDKKLIHFMKKVWPDKDIPEFATR
ncbi:54S ribosomal protein L8, mitochondrial [Spiromyces aspiralis]|uniref:54S ribosomal protein L8, mitochondrial n=1 Tax=Spiromyces aspiralis TaxID=68401 RepID=A0ACC1HQS8_9FUNG|nr:54S ribosomal protein L8, mitochondrial [Spiromyces aspiralis]